MGNDEGKGEISKVLGSAAAPIEEAKADVMGVWNMLYKVTQKSQFQMIITFALVLLIVHPPLHPNNNIHHNLPKATYLHCHLYNQVFVQQYDHGPHLHYLIGPIFITHSFSSLLSSSF